LKVVAIGGKAFVTGFVLAGVSGEYVSSATEALRRIEKLVKDPEVGLIMVSDDTANPIRDQLTDLRSNRPVPLIYEVPGPGSKAQRVEYRAMLRAILGV
jgi:V/A-type H+/Na+-transporting ATPase subunit F